MNETSTLPIIFLVVEEDVYGQNIIDRLREQYGNQYEYVMLTDEAEAQEQVQEWVKKQKQLALTVAEAFLINTPTDDVLAKVNDRFPASYLVYLAETSHLEVSRLSTMPACRIIPKHAPIKDLMEIFAWGIRDFEYRQKRRQDFRVVRSINKHFQELSAQEDAKGIFPRLMKFVMDNTPAERGYYISLTGGKLRIEAAASRIPIEDSALRIRLQKEPEVLNAEVVSSLTELLQELDPDPKRTVISIRRQSRIMAYLFLEHEGEQAVLNQTHRELMTLVVDHLALLLDALKQDQRSDNDTEEETSLQSSAKIVAAAIESQPTENDVHIDFAQGIQQSHLKPAKVLKETFPQSFLIYEPKDRVSSSFYWFTERYHRFLVAAAECNEDSVAAAITTLVTTNLLNEVSNEQAVPETDDLLRQFNEQFQKTFRFDPLKKSNPIYLNMSLCSIDLANGELQFAGAHRPILLFKNGQATELKGDSLPIGLQKAAGQANYFSCQTVPLQTGDTIYLYNEGLVRQMQKNPMNLKSSGTLVEALTEIQEMSMEEQGSLFRSLADQWRKSDSSLEHDLLLLGIRFQEM